MGAKLIILRHGEKPKGKKSSLELSPAGKARAQAIAQNYLGKGAAKTLLGKKGPDAFYAITPHTLLRPRVRRPRAGGCRSPLSSRWQAGAVKDAALDTRHAGGREIRPPCAQARQDRRHGVGASPHRRRHDTENNAAGIVESRPAGRGPRRVAGRRFDTIWIFDCSKKGKPASFSAVPQQFQPAKRKP